MKIILLYVLSPRFYKGFTIGIFTLLLWNCKSKPASTREISSVSIDTILSEKISIRALLLDNGNIWYGADNGRYGKVDLKSKARTAFTAPANMSGEFRSIANTSDGIFILNAGTPAQLFRIDKKTNKTRLCYSESFDKTFYDSMTFWNDVDGIAIGDPVEDCLSIILTRDGGFTWKKTECADLPKVFDGEAAFASSNTNVVVKANSAWIVSGGKKSRVFRTNDKGNTWKVYDTPIIQGSSMTGIFSADFYNESIGIVAGGDYQQPTLAIGNKAISTDGGSTWNLVAENNGFGYASCIQYNPFRDGREIVSVGATGVWYSSDGGQSWTQVSTDKDLYTIRFKDAKTAYAA
ncbi:MAG TPA: oxidoreductase, partial [Flavobacterium sp.]